MIINYLKNDLVTVPKRAKTGDLGYDIVATSDPIIVGEKMPILDVENQIDYYLSIDYIQYETSLQIQPQKDINWRGIERKFHTLAFPRSSISTKNLILKNSIGLIDSGYSGKILMRYSYVWQPSDLVPLSGAAPFCIKVNKDKIYKKGDKIAQLVPYKNIDADFIGVDELDNTDRGEGGFGSTGK